MKRLQLLIFALVLNFCAVCLHAQPFPKAPSSTFTFGVVADVQYCDCDTNGSRYYRASLGKLAEAVEIFNRENPDFVVQLGDLIDRNQASYLDVLPVLQRIEMPMCHVSGNHDFSLNDEVQGKERDRVLELLALERAYYDFRHEGWRFVVLDGNDVSLYAAADREVLRQAKGILDSLLENGAENAQPWNGGLGVEQLSWLDRTLAEADEAGERVILFCHFPVYPENVHNLWNDDEVLAILDAHPSVAAYINGHNHAGNYAVRKGVHYLTLHGMVETPNTTAFALIGVTPRNLQVNGWGREPDRNLELKPWKN